MDFQFNPTADGRRLKFLNVIGVHSHLCLAIRVGRPCRAGDVVEVLEELTWGSNVSGEPHQEIGQVTEINRFLKVKAKLLTHCCNTLHRTTAG
jgi:hypothetical protein